MGSGLDFDSSPQSRGVFHEFLLAHLNEHGASTVAELEQQELSGFYLPLNHDEITDVVESARRHGLVAPLGHRVDGHDRRVHAVEWAPTERGAALRPPLGLSRRGVFSGMAAGQSEFRQIFSDVIALIGFFAGAAVLKQLTEGSSRFIIAGAVLAVLLLILLERGIRAERRLCKAAEAWPRLKAMRPKFYKWQMRSVSRFWALSGAFVLVTVSYGLRLADVIGDSVSAVGVIIAVLIYASIRIRQHEVEQEVALAPLDDYDRTPRAATPSDSTTTT